MGGGRRQGLWRDLLSLFSGLLGHPFNEHSGATNGLWLTAWVREPLMAQRAVETYSSAPWDAWGLAESWQVWFRWLTLSKGVAGGLKFLSRHHS